jgi:hypothetical protein
MSIRGSSLVESLVAASIFSIGSAATGAWLMRSTLADERASRLLAADAIASSLEARMRSNVAGFYSGAYLDPSDTASCARSCTAAAVAADDMRRFREALLRHVGPGADGRVRCRSRQNCVIHIVWQRTEVLAWPFDY